MKIAAVLSSLALIHAAAAQKIQSKPFELVIHSSNKEIHGKLLSSCHEGAVTDTLCLASGAGSHFFLNTSKEEYTPLKDYTAEGSLVWNSPYVNKKHESEHMSFFIDPSTNVALPLFEPSHKTQVIAVTQKVAFEHPTGEMAIFSYLYDTVTPPTDGKVHVLKNWYVCEYYLLGHVSHTLNWVLGDATAKPQNPSCVKVSVYRKFV